MHNKEMVRNTTYFNHTRSTVDKVSTNLVQTAELVCSPKTGELHSNSPRL